MMMGPFQRIQIAETRRNRIAGTVGQVVLVVLVLWLLAALLVGNIVLIGRIAEAVK